jgi:hypothetical protein
MNAPVPTKRAKGGNVTKVVKRESCFDRKV